jgi:hypothetical protein
MYEAYFTKRLLEALSLAESAADAEERSLHLRTSRYYRDLLEYPEKRRNVRYAARIGATLHHLGPRPRRVIVSDLSVSGFRTEIQMPVRPGRLVTLEMDGLSPLEAYIVWQQGAVVGCKFLNDLHPALVEAALAVSSRG